MGENWVRHNRVEKEEDTCFESVRIDHLAMEQGSYEEVGQRELVDIWNQEERHTCHIQSLNQYGVVWEACEVDQIERFGQTLEVAFDVVPWGTKKELT